MMRHRRCASFSSDYKNCNHVPQTLGGYIRLKLCDAL